MCLKSYGLIGGIPTHAPTAIAHRRRPSLWQRRPVTASRPCTLQSTCKAAAAPKELWVQTTDKVGSLLLQSVTARYATGRARAPGTSSSASLQTARGHYLQGIALNVLNRRCLGRTHPSMWHVARSCSRGMLVGVLSYSHAPQTTAVRSVSRNTPDPYQALAPRLRGTPTTMCLHISAANFELLRAHTPLLRGVTTWPCRPTY